MEFSNDYLSGLVESGLKKLQYPEVAPRLFDPVRYTLEGGGKRLRPCLLLAAYAALSQRNPEDVLDQALAVEMFHNFTLLHDDVMDRADIRRGRPTVHVRWNDSVAILSGDAMLTYATQLLAKCSAGVLPDILAIFNGTAMEVYEGQQLDMEFESRQDVTVGEYLEMIRLKTSVLLACALAIGARMADAPEDVRRNFYDYGINLGLAFQLRDDWLDTFGDPAVFGKEIGRDIVNRKKTWLLITALEESDGDLAAILGETLDDAELIRQVVRVYNGLDLSRRCCALAERYSQKALESLAKIDMGPREREYFTSLALGAANRAH